MAVRPGYKQTEVGVIPEDWDVQSVSDFARITTGPFGTLLKASEYTSREGVPLISVGEVREGYFRITDETPRVPEAVTRRLSQYILRKGDIVFGRKGGVQRSALVRDSEAGWFLGSDGISIRPSTEYVHPYLAFQLRSKPVQDWLSQNAIGTTMPSLNQDILRRVTIPIPPTQDEQEAIAGALSDADALIESLEALIAKKHQIKQGVMQKLLTGKTRLRGFSGEWRDHTLLELACGKKENFDDGDWIESEHITGQGIRLIQTGNIGIGSFIEKLDRKYIFEESFISLKCKQITEGDLLICRLAEPAGRACVLPDIGEDKMVTSVDVTIFRPPAELANRTYLANYFSTDKWLHQVSDQSGGTTHKRVSRGALGRMHIKIPRVEEQSAIATILSDMDAEITALEAKLAKARQIKQGMMQELLTGRIRLISGELKMENGE